MNIQSSNPPVALRRRGICLFTSGHRNYFETRNVLNVPVAVTIVASFLAMIQYGVIH